MSPEEARQYLSEYSGQMGEKVHTRWRKLGETLLVKYIDGNVRNEQGKVTHPKYPESWYRRIAQDTGKKLEMPPEPEEQKPVAAPAPAPAQKPEPVPASKPTVAPAP